MSIIQHEKIELSLSQLRAIFEDRIKNSVIHLELNWNSAILCNSKKHYVLKIALQNKTSSDLQNHIIIKLFNDRISDMEMRWKREVENYARLSEIMNEKDLKIHFHVPKIIQSQPGVIILEFIPSETLDTILAKQQFTPAVIAKFAQWLSILHKKGFIFGDQRLNNFLYSELGEIYAVDLEEIQSGNIVDDLAGFLEAFLDQQSKIFTQQIPEYAVHIMLQFLDTYLSHSKDIIRQFHSNTEIFTFFRDPILKYIEKVATRRKISIGSLRLAEIMSELQLKFREFKFK